MFRRLLALAVLLAPTCAFAQFIPSDLGGQNSTGRAPVTLCDSSAQLQMTTATTTQIVALAAGKRVRVCSYQVQGSINATAVTVKFVYGTGTNCATGATNITPAWSLAASAASAAGMISFGSGVGELFATLAGNALCATTSAAGTVNIFVSYAVY